MLNRRSVISGLCAAAAAGCAKVEPPVQWRDVLSVDGITDTDLKTKVSRFLDYFQGQVFQFQYLEQSTGKISIQSFSGQDYLKRIRDNLVLYKETGFYQFAEEQGLMRGGKFSISSQDNKFDGSPQTGCYTKFFGVDASSLVPIEISLSTDYLKRANFRGIDGQLYPVSVEGVLANELSHLAKGIGERTSIDLENIVAVPLGAQQRDYTQEITTNPRQRSSYVSLLEDAGAASPRPQGPRHEKR